MKESDFLRLVQIEASKHGHRLFRNNTGLGWIGKTVHISHPTKMTLVQGDVLLRSARPLHAGLCEGSSDLIGWTRDGKFLAYEIKSDTGILSPKQVGFLEVVNRAGGIGRCIKDLSDVDQ